MARNMVWMAELLTDAVTRLRVITGLLLIVVLVVGCSSDSSDDGSASSVTAPPTNTDSASARLGLENVAVDEHGVPLKPPAGPDLYEVSRMFVAERAREEAQKAKPGSKVAHSNKLDNHTKGSNLPADFKQWLSDDYIEALQQSDPRLKKAIADLGHSSSGEAGSAKILTALLEQLGNPVTAKRSKKSNPKNPDKGEPPSASDQAPASFEELFPLAQGFIGQQTNPGSKDFGRNYSGRSGRHRNNDDVAKILIEALGNNGSQLAWQTLRRMLQGNLDTGIDDAKLVGWVLETLIRHCDSESASQMLLQTLKSPEKLRLGEGDESAQQLQEQSAKLHIEFAASALDDFFGVSVAETKESRPGSAGPPAKGQRPSRANQQPASFEELFPLAKQFSAQQSKPGSRGFGPSNPGGRKNSTGTLQPRQLSPEERQRVVHYMWNSDLFGLVEQRVSAIRRLGPENEHHDFLVLASMLPIPSVRQSVHAILESQWRRGAGALKSVDFFLEVARDPGLMVVLKSLPRSANRATAKLTASKRAEVAAKNSWLEVSGHLLFALMKRLHKATQNSSGSGDTGGPLPIKLHRGAQVADEFKLNWPNEAQDMDALEAAPLSLHYVRMEPDVFSVKNRMEYEKQFRRREQRKLANGVYWFDALRSGNREGYKQSVDVLIQPVQGKFASGQAQYVVEVLVVEVPESGPIVRK